MPPHRMYRRVIRITAEDSPNVRRGLLQVAAGVEPDNREVIPGVLSYREYLKRRATWDPIRQCVGLDARFYAGAENLLYPAPWLNHSEHLARSLQGIRRQALAIGCDPGEGGANTAWAVGDEMGLIELVSYPTPNTDDIPSRTVALARQYGLDTKSGWERVLFDSGGGGKQHADRLRAQGFRVRTVAFGEGVSPPPSRKVKSLDERVETQEERYVYRNRRAQMYGELRLLIDPGRLPEDLPGDPLYLPDRTLNWQQGYGIPAHYHELRRQLSLLPLLYDGEGRLYLPPKRKPPGSNVKSLEEILGCSPDESDALVLMVHGILHRGARKMTVGAIR